jgi:glycine/D-amino acid oxidase-like deaminating enzyme
MEPDLTPTPGARPGPAPGSFWAASAGTPRPPRPALSGDRDADVAIVGGGFTGLWTAYYLALADPSLRVAVVEAEVVGFGASGRNGGWCSALFPASASTLARRYGHDAAVAMYAAMRETVDEVGRVAAAEGIDCGYRKGGTIVLARTPVQLRRARDEVAESDRYGLGSVLLDAPAAREHLAAPGTLGGVYTPHCAAVHPLRLVQGLAEAVERRGVTVYEGSRATRIGPGVVECAGGSLRAPVVVRATEGYSPDLPGFRRVVAPVYSLVVSTPPLPAAFFDEVGLSRRETFSDLRHLIIYGQRTADDRLVFGGRGAPYHYRSRVRPGFDRDPRVFHALRQTLGELFPALGPLAPVTHTWGGPLGVPRDWCASVGLDRATGLAWAGGYVGDGVSTTNLAGRTLADLVTGRASALTRLPWVGHRSRRWEPEPLRWMGVNAGLRLMTVADSEERVTGRPSALAHGFLKIIGR